MINADEITKKSLNDVIDLLKEKTAEGEQKLSADEVRAIGEAELRRSKPRSTILSMCGVEATGSSKGRVVQTLNALKGSWCMVFCKDGNQHFYQDGKVFDFATKEIRLDLMSDSDTSAAAVSENDSVKAMRQKLAELEAENAALKSAASETDLNKILSDNDLSLTSVVVNDKQKGR